MLCVLSWQSAAKSAKLSSHGTQKKQHFFQDFMTKFWQSVGLKRSWFAPVQEAGPSWGSHVAQHAPKTSKM